jgi:hypothetical protein
MVSALMTGILGAALTFWLGARYFGFHAMESLRAIVSSNIAGFFSLLLTLALERRKVIGRVLMGNALKAWIALFVIYSSMLLALDPALFSPALFAVLFAPLVLATGLMLPFWGPTQDQVIRWEHRLRKRMLRNQQFSRPERDVIGVEP